MPEGPEVRRAADRIAKAVQGKVVEDAMFAFEHLQPLESTLVGQRVSAVDTRGKAFLVRFDEVALSVFVHLQLYGRWYVTARGSWPKTGRQLRFAIHTQTHSALLYSASDIAVLGADEVASHPYIAKLGPDCLDPDLTRAKLMRRLMRRAFRNRTLASLYLDQGFVAGVGNYLRSEILYAAGVHPNRRPRDLSVPERRALAEATVAVCRRAYATGGITNSEERVRQLKTQGLPRRRYRHAVFGRGGQPCWACSEAVVRGEQTGRRIFWCPRCQVPAELANRPRHTGH